MTASTGHQRPTETAARDAAPTSGERLTVALIRRAAEDLKQLQSSTDLSKTDIVNRAITLYAFVDAQLQSGRELLVRDSRTGEVQSIRLL